MTFCQLSNGSILNIYTYGAVVPSRSDVWQFYNYYTFKFEMRGNTAILIYNFTATTFNLRQ